MPDLELRPDDYRKQDRDGHWYVPDDPKTLIIGILVNAGVLAFLFWRRAELIGDPAVFFGIVAVFAFSAGVMLALLLKRFGY